MFFERFERTLFVKEQIDVNVVEIKKFLIDMNDQLRKEF